MHAKGQKQKQGDIKTSAPPSTSMSLPSKTLLHCTHSRLRHLKRRNRHSNNLRITVRDAHSGILDTSLGGGGLGFSVELQSNVSKTSPQNHLGRFLFR